MPHKSNQRVVSQCSAARSRPMRVPDKKQIRCIVLEEAQPHESGHCSWSSISRLWADRSRGQTSEAFRSSGARSDGLVQLHHEMEVGYSRLVTISTDNMLLTNEYRDGVGAHWTFLSDPGRKVQKDLDIAEYTDPEHNPMIPHVIVLEPGLVIFKIYNGYWFFGRPTIEELRQDLRAVLKKCRPDWDITRPELKAAWEQGKRDRFYPYGKTVSQVFREQE